MNRIELLESVEFLLSLPRDEQGRIPQHLLEAWTKEPGPRSQNRWVNEKGKVIYSKEDPNGKEKDGQPAKSKSVKSTGDISSAVDG